MKSNVRKFMNHVLTSEVHPELKKFCEAVVLHEGYFKDENLARFLHKILQTGFAFDGHLITATNCRCMAKLIGGVTWVTDNDKAIAWGLNCLVEAGDVELVTDARHIHSSKCLPIAVKGLCAEMKLHEGYLTGTGSGKHVGIIKRDGSVVALQKSTVRYHLTMPGFDWDKM